MVEMLLIWVTLFTSLHENELEAFDGSVVKNMTDIADGVEKEGVLEVKADLVEDLPKTEFKI